MCARRLAETFVQPKGFRKPSTHWIDNNLSFGTETEILVGAFLICGCDRNADEKDKWARDLAKYEKAVLEQGINWKLPEELLSVGKAQIPAAFEMIQYAYNVKNWTMQQLDEIAKAVQGCGLAGAYESLTGKLLDNYLRRLPSGPKLDSRRPPPPRWRSGMAALIGGLIHRHGGPAMRRLIKDPTPKEQLLTLVEAQATIDALQLEVHEIEQSERRAKDQARKTTQRRNKEKADKKAQRAKRRAADKAARGQNKKEIAALKKAANLKYKKRLAVEREKLRPAAEAAAAGRLEGRIETSKTWRNRANKRAREAENNLTEALVLSDKRLKRAEAAETKVSELRVDLDRHVEHYAAALQAKNKYETIGARLQSVPTWSLVRPEGTGRGARTLEPVHRECMWELMSLGVPAPKVGKAIVAVVQRATPWITPIEPTASTLRQLRFEMRTVEETLAGRRVAEAVRVRQLGLDQTTKFHIPSMVTSVLIEPEGKPAEVVILRAAYGTGAGGSENEALAIEDKCFARLRSHLKSWEAKCKEMFPDYNWTGPDAKRCGLQRLGGGGCIINDTCTPAQCTQRILIGMVKQQVEEKYDAAEWAQLTATEQEAAVRCHAIHCWQHIRNIFLAPMSAAYGCTADGEARRRPRCVQRSRTRRNRHGSAAAR